MQVLHAAMADPSFYRKDRDEIAGARKRLEDLERDLAAAYRAARPGRACRLTQEFDLYPTRPKRNIIESLELDAIPPSRNVEHDRAESSGAADLAVPSWVSMA